eukprot:GEMP01051783.1.p1 GENE.GEMP01051783.1~~GEMP01051783.1.p1  ORF type:complete len:419 (+),score=63.94 GEMP01051783.1:120-1376(+)
MKLLIFIFVLPHADAVSLSPTSEDITIEGSTQSDSSRPAKRPEVADTVQQPVAKIPRFDEGIHVAVAPPEEMDDSGIPISSEEIYASSEKLAVLPADPEQSDPVYNIAEPGIAPVADRYPSSHAQPESSFGKAGTAAVYGESHPSVIVTTEARHNAFLAGISSLFAASFAGPVVDPSMTRQIELEPRGTPLDDATLGMGETKTGKFYVLKGTDEEVVIKWFKMHELRKTENLGLVLADFHSQSIAHLLSQVYSERVRDAEKVYYMQPLLVTSRADDGVVHYGLMERKLGSFDLEAPSPALESRFYDFQNFVNNEALFIALRDVQGWNQRDAGLFMTDALLEIYDADGGSELIGAGTDYMLPEIYNTLVRRVQVMKNEPMDLSLQNTGDDRSIFGISMEDDEVTIREIQNMKTQCVLIE